MSQNDPRVRLKEVLLSELILYTRLLGIEEQKKQAMVSLDSFALEKIVGDETEVVEKIRRLEGQRVETAARICQDYGLDPRNCGLEEIAAAMDASWQEEFLNLRARLKEVSVDIEKTNDLNKRLCVQSLDHIQVTLNAISGASQNRLGAYSKAGVAPGVVSTRQLIDQRV